MESFGYPSMEFKEYIIVLISMLSSMLILIRKDKLAISLAVFSIPYILLPFQKYEIILPPNAILFISMYMSLLLRKSIYNNSHSYLNLKVLYYFLIAGAITPLVKDNLYLDTFLLMPPWMQVLNYSLSIFAIISFFEIVQPYTNDNIFISRLKIIYVCTIYTITVSYLLIIFGFQNYVPTYLVGGDNIDPTAPGYRFATLVGGPEELAVIVIFVISFSAQLLVSTRHRLIPISAIICAISLGLASGSRSFILMIAIFSLLFLLFSLFRYSSAMSPVMRKSFLVFIVIASISYVAAIKFNLLHVFDRLQETSSGIALGKFESVTNRNISDSAPEIFKLSGIFGNGSLYFVTINGDYNVAHNSFLAIVAKYGLVGLFIVIMVLYKWLLALWHSLNDRTMEGANLQQVIVIFASLVALLVQENVFNSINKISLLMSYSLLALATLNTKSLDENNV